MKLNKKKWNTTIDVNSRRTKKLPLKVAKNKSNSWTDRIHAEVVNGATVERCEEQMELTLNKWFEEQIELIL